MKVYNWEKIPDEKVREGVIRRGFGTPNVMLVYHELHPGMETKPHSHTFEQVVYIMKGTVVFTVDGVRHSTCAGDVFCIAPGETHFAEVTDTKVAITLDVFAPPREDYQHLVSHQKD